MAARFSLISSTRDATISPRATSWLTPLQSSSCETIIISNPGRCGLGQAYNEGLAKATGEFCCFLHDDVEIGPEDWLERFARAVTEDGFDLVGVAGTTRLERNGAWWEGGAGTGRGSVFHRQADGTLLQTDYGPPDNIERQTSPVVSLDGIVLFGRRESFLSQPFDTEFFDGFHFYDSDLCLRWQLEQGRRLGVVHSLNVVHEAGASLEGWQAYLSRFHARHGGFLPVSVEDVPVWRANLLAIRDTDARLANTLRMPRRPGRVLTFESSVPSGKEIVNADAPDGVIARAAKGNILLAEPVVSADWPASSDPVILLGAGSGRLIDDLLNRTAADVIVVEPEAHLVCWLLCRRDWSEPIRSGRLRWLVPSLDQPEAAAISLQQISAELRRQPVGDRQWIEGGSLPLHRPFFEKLRTATIAPAEIRRRAAGWPRGAGKSTWDVTVVSPKCAIFNDIAGHFQALGHSVRLFQIPDRPAEWSKTRWLHALRSLIEEPSRVVLFRNRVLLETMDSESPLEAWRLLEGKLVSWWWDVPNVASVIDLADETARHPAFAFARAILPLLPAGSQWLPPGARSQFVEAGSAPTLESEMRHPITFVGQSRFDQMQAHLNVLANALAYFAGRIGRQLATEVNQASGMNAIHQVLRDRREDLKLAIHSIQPGLAALAYYLDYLLEMSVTAAFRLAAVERLKGFPLVVFGDDGWQRSGAVTAEQYGGLIAPASLAKLYASSKINLNLNFMQVSSTVNPKVLDVCAAGGTVVTDARPELADLFPHADCRPASFESLQQLPDLVSDLLKADLSEQRLRLQEHVLAQHTLRHRVAWLAEALGLSTRSAL